MNQAQEKLIKALYFVLPFASDVDEEEILTWIKYLSTNRDAQDIYDCKDFLKQWKMLETVSDCSHVAVETYVQQVKNKYAERTKPTTVSNSNLAGIRGV